MPVQAQSRAAAQDRTNQKLVAKQDRINFLESKRTTLLQHLASLRQDISSLDVSIRVPSQPLTSCMPASPFWASGRLNRMSFPCMARGSHVSAASLLQPCFQCLSVGCD